MSEIRLENVTYKYDVGGVENISFVVPEEKVVSLTAASGAGKTTTLKLIAGIIAPQQGKIIINGVVVSDSGEIVIPTQKRDVGFVFQQHALFPHMTIAENILFGCKHKDKLERQDLLNDLLASLKISQHTKRYPHEISGGEQQRVSLARALASDPKVLLLDEPFASLDQSLRIEVQKLCMDIIKKRKITTILVTHDQDSASFMVDSVWKI